MKKVYRVIADVILWSLVIWGIWALFSCNRKPRFEQFEDVPNLPPDTVYVSSKPVSRSNYYYLNANPKIAGAKMKIAVKALDSIVLVYEHDLKAKSARANLLYRQLQEHDALIKDLESRKAEKKKITYHLFAGLKLRYESQNEN